MVVGGRAAVQGHKLAFMWFMNENLGGDGPWHWARLLSSQVLGAWRAYGDEASDVPLQGVHPRPPLLVKPPKRHEQGPQGPT